MDSASGDIHPNEEDDDTSSVSGSERSCPPTPLDSHTDVSHSESKKYDNFYCASLVNVEN